MVSISLSLCLYSTRFTPLNPSRQANSPHILPGSVFERDYFHMTLECTALPRLSWSPRVLHWYSALVPSQQEMFAMNKNTVLSHVLFQQQCCRRNLLRFPEKESQLQRGFVSFLALTCQAYGPVTKTLNMRCECNL